MSRLKEKPTAWSGHLSFGYQLCKLLKPQTVVELGVHFGHSLNAFASGVRDSGRSGKVYGIDTWQGDQHTGDLGDEVYDFAKEVMEPHGDTVELIRSTFDAAALDFDRKIDILHIDGEHTYEAVFNDYNTWLEKMRPYGVVLMHDTQVFEYPFGVHKLWKEIQAQHPEWFYHEFEHSFGLGVICFTEARYNKIKSEGLFDVSNYH